MKKNLQFLLLIYFLFLVIEGKTQEGNYKFENYGNQTVLLNGNVTGSANDLGLTFYNPARLALLDKPSFVIAGKAYEWSKYRFKDVLGTSISLNTSNFNGIPSIVAGTFNLKFLPKHKFAFAIISRYRSDISINYTSGIQETPEFDPIENEARRFTDVGFRKVLRDEWYGITWSYPIKENFSIGLSLFGSMYRKNGMSKVFVSAERMDNSVVSYSNNFSYSQKTYGLFLKMGLAWRLSNIDIGANFSLPFISVKDKASLRSEEFLSGISPEQDYFAFVDLGDLENKRRTAASFAIGAGIPIGKSTIHLDGSWHSKLDRYQRIVLPEVAAEATNLDPKPFEEEFRSVINFGAGLDIYVSPSLKIISSFSSDFSARKSGVNLIDVIDRNQGDFKLEDDYWHFGLGTDLKLKWGHIVLGATYSSTSNTVVDDIEIPDGTPDDGTSDVLTKIKFERWRFIIGLEIPILEKKIKGLPVK